MWKRSFRARLPPKCESWRCENEAFVRDLPQNVIVEDVKTKLSCETSFKKLKLKMWKWSFRARLPSKSGSGRCENDSFVQDFLQIWKFKWRKWSFRARLLSKSESGRNMWERNFRARPPSKCDCWRCENKAFVQDLLQKVKVEDVKMKLSCETPLEVEDVKTTLSCKTSFKFWKFKWWTWSLINFQFHRGADPRMILV